MRYLTYSLFLHGLLAAALLVWAPAALKSAAPAIVRVLLLSGEEADAGGGGPEARAPAAPVSENAEAPPKPAVEAVPRVRLVDAARTHESALPAPPALRAPDPSAGEGPARVASLVPSAGPPASEAAGAERDRRIALIQARIQQALFYPRVARRRGVEGTVHVRFGIRQDGRVDGLAVARSSGHRLLDRASVKTIERAQPFHFIDGALEVPVVFRLTGDQ